MFFVKVVLCFIAVMAVLSVADAANSFAYCASYPEWLCRMWEPIDSSCRWCPGMGVCAPYCTR